MRAHICLKLFVTAFFLSVATSSDSADLVQDNPVLAPDLSTPPIVDGQGDDACWQDLSWQSMDQVWIPWGGTVDSEDYSGHYKVAWSSAENVLYFLVEISDDYLVDGFIPAHTADIYNFDIIEVFIDEDNSGGYHVFDGAGNVAQQYGTNAENAFAYHMYCPFPEDGQVDDNLYVGDLDGTSWSDVQNPNYADHFPAFALRRNGDTIVREFSLMVYDDTYEKGHVDAARVQLTEGREIGLSLAYCDNDGIDENPKTRDNFFGSVWVPAVKFNDHWIDAGDFGTVKLTASPMFVEVNKMPVQQMQVFPNPGSTSLHVEMHNDYCGDVKIYLYNILGQNVLQTSASKMNPVLQKLLSLQHLPQGVYFLEVRMGITLLRRKIIIH
ncbi:T9SS type A sorting domain-containing protein [bacterium]|nr:T9SS type A sorting domain-containing protein [bacterium]